MTTNALAQMMAVVAALGPMPARPRIIVGVPGIAENTWCEAPDNRYLVGEIAWKKLQNFLETADASDPNLHAAEAMMLGVPVEHYDPSLASHREVMLRVLMARDETTTPVGDVASDLGGKNDV